MKEAIELWGNLTIAQILVYILAIGFMVKIGLKVWTTFSSINKKLDIWEKTITVTEDNVRRLDEQRAKMELLGKYIESQKEVEKDIRDLTRLFEDEKEFNINYQRRSLADKLFTCYHAAQRQGYITRSQLDNFNRNVEMYEARGGNGIVHEVYIPGIQNLPIKE